MKVALIFLTGFLPKAAIIPNVEREKHRLITNNSNTQSFTIKSRNKWKSDKGSIAVSAYQFQRTS
jgi:hypothetical protein